MVVVQCTYLLNVYARDQQIYGCHLPERTAELEYIPLISLVNMSHNDITSSVQSAMHIPATVYLDVFGGIIILVVIACPISSIPALNFCGKPV